MEMDPQERESELGDESPVVSANGDISDGEGESGRDPEDGDSGDEMRRHNALLADHGDVLAKLKMQVRDIKVGGGLHPNYQDEYENARHLNFPLGARALPGQENFHLPPTFPFQHPNAPFPPPVLPPPAAPSSGSSHSSEGSASSQHTWSFEEQFKQVRQLYEINDDPKRKEFLDDLFSFMQKRGTPINRLPIMAKSVLDLYELYNLVIARGGLVDVINKKLWQEIIKGLHLPSSITSAAFTLRTQYMKYLYPYECDKRRLSTPAELQAAIDGNRREGRRSSYGQYDAIQRSPNPVQISSLSLVTQHQQLAACMNSVINSGIQLHNGAHHPTHPQPLGQQLNGGPIPGMAPNEFEARMREYVKLLSKDTRNTTATPPPGLPTVRHSDDNVQANDAAAAAAVNSISQLSLWNFYTNAAQGNVEPQKEALNLADNPPAPVKRERDEESSPINKKAKDDGAEKEEPKTHIRMSINTKGDSHTNDSPILFSMDLNGVTYQGVLSVQPAESNGRTSLGS